MQSLMHDQPQPACDSPKHNSGESGDCDHHGAPNRLSRSGRWGGSVIFSGYLALCLPQSSSASRFTAGAFGFLTFSQSGERPRR